MKKLLLAPGVLVSVVLVALIAVQMTPPTVEDSTIPSQSAANTSITVLENEMEETTSNMAQEAQNPTQNQPEDNPNGDGIGTEQTIQSPPQKPEHTEEELQNPDMTPDGTPVDTSGITPQEEIPVPQEEPQPVPTVPTVEPTPQPQPSGGLPGFGNVPSGGGNTVTAGESTGDINTQVGEMG